MGRSNTRRRATNMGVYIAFLSLILVGISSFAQTAGVTWIGQGGDPKWSPDGKYLSYISLEGLMLYVVDSGYSRNIAPASRMARMPGYRYVWNGLDELILLGEENGRDSTGRFVRKEISSFFVDGRESILFEERYDAKLSRSYTLKRLSNGEYVIAVNQVVDTSVTRLIRHGEKSDPTAFYVDINYGLWPGIKKDRDLWMVGADGTPIKRITHNLELGLVSISPDGKYISSRVNGVVIDLDGNIVTDFRGKGEIYSWLPDSRRLTMQKIKQSHFDLEASDIWIIDITGKQEYQITDTPDIIETDPVVSPDMKWIAYVARGDDIPQGIRIVNIEGLLEH